MSLYLLSMVRPDWDRGWSAVIVSPILHQGRLRLSTLPLLPRRLIRRTDPDFWHLGLAQWLGVYCDLGDLREGLAELEFDGFGNVMHFGDGEIGL